MGATESMLGKKNELKFNNLNFCLREGDSYIQSKEKKNNLEQKWSWRLNSGKIQRNPKGVHWKYQLNWYTPR